MGQCLLRAPLGGDELARRGMVAQGNTPGEEFAITSGRADAIREDEQPSDLQQAFGVADINHRNDMPIANIKAATSRPWQDIKSLEERIARPAWNPASRADAPSPAQAMHHHAATIPAVTNGRSFMSILGVSLARLRLQRRCSQSQSVADNSN